MRTAEGFKYDEGLPFSIFVILLQAQSFLACLMKVLSHNYFSIQKSTHV